MPCLVRLSVSHARPICPPYKDFTEAKETFFMLILLLPYCTLGTLKINLGTILGTHFDGFAQNMQARTGTKIVLTQ
ncbi:MAG: hypothetical protein LBE85_05425 [Candidatus Accumulibacter sp.]|jgi:hypothetical protein|nr:hypothetical protein [Accumulibacter sp.]